MVKSDGEDLWVANLGNNTVSQVHARNGKLLNTWAGATEAVGVLVAMGRVFVTGRTSPGNLYMIDPRAPGGVVTEVTSSKLGPNALGISFDGERIWTTNQGEKGDYEIAAQSFERQLRLAEELGDTSQAALAHSAIGNLLSNQEDYPAALRHFETAYSIDKSTGPQISVGYHLMNCGRMLWQLGRYEDARSRFRETSPFTDRPDGNKQLLALVTLNYARIAPSQTNFKEARLKSQQVITLSAGQYNELDIQAEHTLGLAESLGGDPRTGIPLCEQAVTAARTVGNQRLLSGALLAFAEALLEGGDAQGALKTAEEARQAAASLKQQESQWRSMLVAGRATYRTSDRLAAKDYADRASVLLHNLSNAWGIVDYNSYITRPDVIRLRRKLAELTH